MRSIINGRFRIKVIWSAFHLFVITTANAQDKQVAITIDDLPCVYCTTTEEQQEVIGKLIGTLKEYNAPAIGFVNEGKLYEDKSLDEDRVKLLSDWLDAGLDLGNHTYSHISIDRATVDEYEKDLIAGEKITRPLMGQHGRELKYFRHTQLRTGPTPQYKERLDEVLKKHKYVTAPVTFDNDEYIYGYSYHKAKLAGDSASMRIIAYEYIDHMKRVFWHYKSLSRKMLGRNIAHVLLIHANELNADHLPHILDVLRADDYAFATLDEVLKDEAYQLPEAQSARGLSWLLRWQLASGEEISEHPSASDRIQEVFQQARNGAPIRSLRSLEGDQAEIDAILHAIKDFSRAYRDREYAKMAEAYTRDGKIMPDGVGIIDGHDRIEKRWRIPEDRSIEEHIVTPVEITIVDDTAYDHGYYEGATRMPDGSLVRWTGKYVVVWKKEDGEWKMYLDIWNSI
jgi:ketosteroid isomerase-like protein/peptidoglycan/xylan/chitin deacetylase (PgdA/CDA1 family)